MMASRNGGRGSKYPGKLVEEIEALKAEKKATILAHNYQLPEVQDVADIVGDSLGLSLAASHLNGIERIVFCGVRFMAETAAIACPKVKVLLPELDAGCSLSSSITADDVRRWKAENPGAVVVAYVNTTAEVKAESDYCCTSANAVKVLNAIPPGKEILFLPDMFLGAYATAMSGRKAKLWPGECHVHAPISIERINRLREEHPRAEILVHPECGCMTNCLYLSSQGMIGDSIRFLSTDGMMRHVASSKSKEFVIATEVGILHRMRKEHPDKTFIPADEGAVCKYMKMTTLEKVLRSLREDVHEIRVPEDVASRARLAIDRMLALA
jgi:quinolinate synthase